MHNDDNQGGADDIAVAQISETTGALVQDVPIAGTDGFEIDSSVLASGPDTDNPATPANETGNRRLFFIANKGGDSRLFRVPVTGNASSDGATIGAATDTGDIDANRLSSPTIAFLNNADGTPTPYVTVGTSTGPTTQDLQGSGSVRTYAAANLAAGPSFTERGVVTFQTPTVPITPSGNTPGAPMSGATKAPFLYAAAVLNGEEGGLGIAFPEDAQVFKLTQEGNSQTLTAAARSNVLDGVPAPALSTDQETEATGPAEGRVLLTTGANFYSLNTQNLKGARSLSARKLTAGSTGFGETSATSSGDFAYVARDNGEQLVLRIADAKRVDPSSFVQDRRNAGSKASFGQPSLSRSFVQYASDKGVFVYRNACGNRIVGTPGADNVPGTEAGDDTFGAAGDDFQTGMVGDDCLTGNDGNDTLAGGDGADFHIGGFGNDTLFGGNGNDSLNGGSDDDRITGGPGDDRLRGGLGDDFLRGTAGDDRVSGGLGSDTLTGGQGDDVITSSDPDPGCGIGDDCPTGSRNGEADRVSCGPGKDVARVDSTDRVARNCERVIRNFGAAGGGGA